MNLHCGRCLDVTLIFPYKPKMIILAQRLYIVYNIAYTRILKPVFLQIDENDEKKDDT